MTLFTKETTVKINVVQIDGKKLTIPILKQIRYGYPFDDDLNFTGKSCLGFVHWTDVNFLTFTKGTIVYKRIEIFHIYLNLV